MPRFNTVRVGSLALLSCLLASEPAAAVTPAELVELARAGLSEDVLLALVETTGVPEPVDAASAIALKRSGVSDRVIAAAVRASQPLPPVTDPEPLADCAGCWDHSTASTMDASSIQAVAPPTVEREVYREVYVYVPVAVGPPARPVRQRPAKPYFEGDRGFGRFINDGVALPRDPKSSPRR